MDADHLQAGMTPEIWHGCYDANWKGLITPAAFAHPAKMARGLLVRIYDELFALGAVHVGDVVVDPFGGIGTTAIEGASRGVLVVCCELEEKFATLARQNFEGYAREWTAMDRPFPIIVQGDSRTLRATIGSDVRAMAMISSPPYIGSLDDGGPEKAHPDGYKRTNDWSGYGRTQGQLGRMKSGEAVAAMRSSPPYVSGGHHPDQTGSYNTNGRGQRGGGSPTKELAGYGKTDGQLGQLHAGDVSAVISSPPYAEIASGSGGLNTKPPKHTGQQGGRSAASASQDTDSRYGNAVGQLAKLPSGDVDWVVSSPPFLDARSNTTPSVKGSTPTDHDPEEMGITDGNLNGMSSGSIDGVVSSPPWENGADGALRAEKFKDPMAFARSMSGADGHGARNGTTPESRLAQMERSAGATYGDAAGQMGNQSGDTFWSAAKQIVAESFAILKPGGYAVWVVKAFVRDKAIVDFPGDWRKLCEHIGFETMREIHASLVAEEHVPDLFGAARVRRRERKSFFRRLAEKKGSPRIDHETVWFMRKPL